MEVSTAFNHIDPDAQIGVGVSRPKETARTRLYRVETRLKCGSKMVVIMPAENMKRAKMYAKNRWPGSKVDVSEHHEIA